MQIVAPVIALSIAVWIDPAGVTSGVQAAAIDNTGKMIMRIKVITDILNVFIFPFVAF
jgi:hypothetical protein